VMALANFGAAFWRWADKFLAALRNLVCFACAASFNMSNCELSASISNKKLNACSKPPEFSRLEKINRLYCDEDSGDWLLVSAASLQSAG
ncbi:hypothetical protein N9389_00285, partial [bacterium]|nr:hypothetical protein [bacterium]